MFKRFFRKHKSDKLSKIDYWKKWELFELFDDLNNAEKLLNYTANNNEEDDFAKFKSDFIEELHEIEDANIADFTKIWEWFTPTKEWETFVGQPGKQLGQNIFRITDKWKRNQDF